MNDKYLNGIWEYRISTKKAWKKMLLPGNWEISGLKNHKGKVYFRKIFNINTLQKDKNYWLKFFGVDYKAIVSLNGKKIGTHTGYFQPFEFQITKYLKIGKNTLVVQVDSCPEKNTDWPENKRTIKGVFGHHDIRPGGWHPKHGQNNSTGGIWNDIIIEKSDITRIKDIFVTSKLDKNYSRAKVEVKILLQTNDKIKTVYKNITIDKPMLWWPWDHGKPNLYTFEFKFGEITKKVVFGIREIKFDKDKNLFLNGRKIFVRGTNIIPEEYLSQYTKKKIQKDVKLAKNANINTLRLHAHVNRKEFYETCDREGILVWQDFPLQWEYINNSSFIKEAKSQLKDMINLLYNHPSIVFWCCHNEPLKSKKKLSPLLAETASKADKSRPVIVSSDFYEHPYPGWFVGKMDYFSSIPGKPLVTEFGAQGLPPLKTLKKIFPKKSLWPPDWKKWAYHNFAYEQTFHIAEIDKGRSIKEFIKNSQDYQSKYIKFAIEQYRAQKNTQISGIFHFMFVDPWPCISYSVLDYFRNPKKGYFTLKKVYQPVLLIYMPERSAFTIGGGLCGLFYLVNDYPFGFKNAKLKIKLGKFQYPVKKLDIKPNSCILANKFVYPLPLSVKHKPGKYPLVLALYKNDNTLISTNNYEVTLKHIPEGLLEYNAKFNWIW